MQDGLSNFSHNRSKASVEGEKSIDLVTFYLANEKYGIDIMQTDEIIRMERLTPIPNSLDFVEGVINLRGNVIPIIDLKKRFNIFGGTEKSGNIIVLKLVDTTLGILIDRINKVMKIPASKILPPPLVVAGIGREYITGVGKDEDDQLLIILDINKLLSYEELEKMKEIK